MEVQSTVVDVPQKLDFGDRSLLVRTERAGAEQWEGGQSCLAEMDAVDMTSHDERRPHVLEVTEAARDVVLVAGRDVSKVAVKFEFQARRGRKSAATVPFGADRQGSVLLPEVGVGVP